MTDLMISYQKNPIKMTPIVIKTSFFSLNFYRSTIS